MGPKERWNTLEHRTKGVPVQRVAGRALCSSTVSFLSWTCLTVSVAARLLARFFCLSRQGGVEFQDLSLFNLVQFKPGRPGFSSRTCTTDRKSVDTLLGDRTCSRSWVVSFMLFWLAGVRGCGGWDISATVLVLMFRNDDFLFVNFTVKERTSLRRHYHPVLQMKMVFANVLVRRIKCLNTC